MSRELADPRPFLPAAAEYRLNPAESPLHPHPAVKINPKYQTSSHQNAGEFLFLDPIIVLNDVFHVIIT